VVAGSIPADSTLPISELARGRFQSVTPAGAHGPPDSRGKERQGTGSGACDRHAPIWYIIPVSSGLLIKDKTESLCLLQDTGPNRQRTETLIPSEW